MSKKPLEYEPVPHWRKGIPLHLEHTEWKRDECGQPVFHTDGSCQRCKKDAVIFSSPWFKFKYQILGYCEGCTTIMMGPAPDLTPRPPKKRVTAYTVVLRPDAPEIYQLELL